MNLPTNTQSENTELFYKKKINTNSIITFLTCQIESDLQQLFSSFLLQLATCDDIPWTWSYHKRRPFPSTQMFGDDEKRFLQENIDASSLSLFLLHQ